MKDERGSVTVFMSAMLLGLIMFFMVVISLAKSMVVASLTFDEKMTVQASLYASYNKPIRDAYGLTVYTKSPARLSHDATAWLNESTNPLSLNPSINKAGNFVTMNGNVEVSYNSSDSLAIDSNFIDLMVGFIKERDTLGNQVTPTGVYAISSNLEKANVLRNRFVNDIQDAQNDCYPIYPKA